MDLPKHWIVELFKVFQSRYLHKWTSAIEGIEETAVNEWSAGLAGLTGEQLKHGVDGWKEKWPPSMDEFRDLCTGTIRGKNGFGLDYIPEVYREPEIDKAKLLPSNEKTEECKKANLSKIKGILSKYKPHDWIDPEILAEVEEKEKTVNDREPLTEDEALEAIAEAQKNKLKLGHEQDTDKTE